jgi:hypothetical protein
MLGDKQSTKFTVHLSRTGRIENGIKQCVLRRIKNIIAASFAYFPVHLFIYLWGNSFSLQISIDFPFIGRKGSLWHFDQSWALLRAISFLRFKEKTAKLSFAQFWGWKRSRSNQSLGRYARTTM